MLEENVISTRPKRRIDLQPFAINEAYQQKSYAQNYKKTYKRLIHELLYDATCFFTSNTASGIKKEYKQPCKELSIKNFAISLHAQTSAFAKFSSPK